MPDQTLERAREIVANKTHCSWFSKSPPHCGCDEWDACPCEKAAKEILALSGTAKLVEGLRLAASMIENADPFFANVILAHVADALEKEGKAE